MKYTNYILNTNFVNIDCIISDNPILKPFTIGIGLVVASFAIMILSFFLLGAFMIDAARYGKLQWYYFIKKYHKYKYFNDVLISLNVPRKKRNEMKYLLINI